MIGILLCSLAFAFTYWRARRSLASGLIAVLAVGYAYGLLRARIQDVGTHFVFDVAAIGLYLARFTLPTNEREQARSQTARLWTLALVGWPLICIAYSPALEDAQPFIIQLVGLRDAVIALPCLILGAQIRRADMDELAPAVAVLNLVALTFAVLEYVYGIEAFIPQASFVSGIVYATRDVAGAGGESFFRIPSTFTSSHVYGGVMVLTLPFVAHGFESGRRVRLLCWAGFVAAVVGTFLCGARSPVAMMIIATMYALVSLRMRASTFVAFGIAALCAAYLVTHVDRLQRFETLSDTEMIESRLAGSVNLSFFDVLISYPMGAGLAKAFGTSIPYFLTEAAGVRPQFGLENEYGHLLLEEGIVGLALWSCFIVITTVRKNQKVQETSPTATLFVRSLTVYTWITAVLGVGVMHGTPSAIMLFSMMGMRLASPQELPVERAVRHVGARLGGFGSPRLVAAATTTGGPGPGFGNRRASR